MVAALKRTRTREALMQDIADLKRDKRELLFIARELFCAIADDPAGTRPRLIRALETRYSTITGRCTICSGVSGHKPDCLITEIFG